MIGVPNAFHEWKRRISDVLSDTLKIRGAEFESIHDLGADSCARLERFSVSGKLIRGGLVCLGAALDAGDVSEPAVQAGAAIELFQSALLVHDDIMDRDERRRGAVSVYAQYARVAESEGMAEATRVGESLGICAGDIAFFIAFELLANLDLPAVVTKEIVVLCSRELQYVGVAQMADVYRGATSFTSSTDTVGESDRTLRIYLYKTGRYTFALPLMVGALISGADSRRIEILEHLGEKLGVLFQIKDDEIGTFGREIEIGKPVGSDIREGKKTIYYTELLSAVDGSERERLDSIFGNTNADDRDIEWVKSLIESSGVSKTVAAYVDRYASEADAFISRLGDVHEPTKAVIRELHEYNMHRSR